MRKAFAILVSGLCFAVVVRIATAQEATATPEPTAAPQTSSSVPSLVGLDVFQRASDALNAGQYDQAIVDYSMFIWLNPTNSQAYLQRGVSYLQLQNLDSALADINEALALPAPSDEFTARAYYLRALIYQDMNDIDAALKDLNAGIAASPTVSSLFFQRGAIYASQSNLDDAVSDFNEAISIDPKLVEAYSARATIYAAQGKLDEAAADFGQLIELAPDDYRPYLQRARIYVQQQDYEAALDDFNEVLKIEPRLLSVYLERGSVNTQMGNTAAAVLDYYQWLEPQQQRLLSGGIRPGESRILQLSEGNFYLLEFDAKAGQKITLSASAQQGNQTDPLIILMDGDRNLLLADDDSGGNFDSKIEDYAVPADGSYGLLVGYAGGGSDGPVRVRFTVDG